MHQSIVQVAAGIIWQNKQYLAAQRPAHALHGGFWEFPGGKINTGETPEAALCRELQEELGILVLEYRLWKTLEHHYPERHVRLHMYHVSRFSGIPHAKEGQSALRFVSPQEGAYLTFLQADVALVHELASSAIDSLLI